MMPGETYADFAAGLRDASDRNLVEELVLLAQFYRCLNLTVRQLVKLWNPTTLEQAVDYATKIDDTNANAARGMQNIGQPWATAPSPYLIPMKGTTGQTMVIPGVGGTGMPLDAMVTTQMATASGDARTISLFTNPQGVWNKFSGTWDVPKGRQWNSKLRAETARKERKSSAEPSLTRGASGAATRADKKAKAMLAAASSDSSDDGTEAGPPPKRAKTNGSSVRQVTTPDKEEEGSRKRNDWRHRGTGATEMSPGVTRAAFLATLPTDVPIP
ncbi:unnamed protein product [Phytophthora fragariaefolia]|uniref:Unnamed protein product n=1 Tax=Phytophthora fragariaefolia TaxID=1490495 RepID=A0A9W7CXH7_9STRA|nr:unnamed protein product [Phytophthora fragariaefolia]